jgi:hypothetical protein
MFAQKSMDNNKAQAEARAEAHPVSYSLLKLKLDMVYRDLPMEEAQAAFGKLTETLPTTETPAADAVKPVEPVKPKKKTIKRIIPKTT